MFLEPELKKTLSRLDYCTLAFGTIIGAGWVIMVGDWLEKAGSLGAMLAFVAGGLLLLTVGACYAEMCAAMPTAGGSFAFCLRGLGPRAAFASGWLLAGGYIAICPWEAIAVGRIAGYLWPSLNRWMLYSVGGSPVHAPQLIIGVGLVLLITWMNHRGVAIGMTLQKIITFGLVGLCVVFVVFGLATTKSFNLEPLFAGSTAASAAAGFFSILAVTPFFMAGFESIPQGAEEAASDLPVRDLGRSIIRSLIAATAFYAMIIFVVALVVPRHILAGEEFPTAKAFAVCFSSPFMGNLVLVAAIMGLVSTLNGCFLSATRVLFAMGREGLLPQTLARIHPQTQTPVHAISLVGAISVLGCFFGRAALVPVANVASLFFMTVWAMVSFVCLKLRFTEPELARPYRMPCGRLVASLAVLLTGMMIFMVVYPTNLGSLVWPTEYLAVSLWYLSGLTIHLGRSSGPRCSVAERGTFGSDRRS